MRIAIDIDSTLHHYWDELAAASRRRFGVDLPYDQQHTWVITRLREEQLRAAIADTHTDAAIARAMPYPQAVDIVNEWHAEGHFIHVTSHRAEHCLPATARWLDAIGLTYDDLHCSSNKIVRCVELQIDILIDDSPTNLVRALDAGMLAATITHPWNREVCEDEDVVHADDWTGLAAALDRRCSLRSRAA
jgi:hypothetical protein